MTDTATVERTGWRDQALSLRHRRWGFNCPGVDLDFVLLEYHLSKPVAIVEYKHERAQYPDLSHPSYQAMVGLANRVPALPLFVARYWPDTWAIHLIAVNDMAKSALGRTEARLSERQYVVFLHQLRATTAQNQVIAGLNTLPPPPKLALVQ